MKHTEVTLVPITPDDREQFILDNQWSFKHSALLEFGERDNHIDEFWCEYFAPTESIPDGAPDEGPDEMFHFVKRMKEA
ncbi:MAG: hypothetical protein Q4C54_08335 [Clostridia bacterium]|nr:hypothetical protein [Clostridia bacterium]